ncbi:MAG: lantibiotic dehydratase [Bacteroidetes bacterium]|nr:lantibiotic dehydratase [Bacteroidota bacterium]
MSLTQKNEFPFHFRDELVLRTPAMPFISFIDEAMVDALPDNANFMEAVYLASPVLHAECLRWRRGELTDAKEITKIKLSLTKYYQRMYSRCTPFGLFSGCSVVQWEKGNTGIELPPDHCSRSTRLDMHYLCALGQHISSLPGIREQLKYYPNNSHYKMGEELRYIEYRYVKGKRMHQISSVLYSEYLQWVLSCAAAGARIPSLIHMLEEKAEVEKEEAAAFVDDLIDSQVLISELDPAITGEEFIHQLLQVLKSLQPQPQPATQLIPFLEQVVRALEEIDKQAHTDTTVYDQLAERLQDAGVSFELNKLFQVDMFGKPVQGSVSDSWQQELKGAIHLLARIFPVPVNDTMQAFADRFRRRYEDQAVPLLQVLDAETGIGYTAQSGRNLSPLLENIAMPAVRERDSYDIKWNKTEQWLFQLLLNNRDKTEVELDEKMAASFAADLPAFPPSFPVVFSLNENGQLIFRGCSGSSAANLLGRFAHGDEHIHELVNQITATEQQQNPGVLFAEIIHLPEDRVGNILLHPAFREYEIPFLAQSSLPVEKQIPVQDILIQVSQDKQVRLYHAKSQQEIIPRLSNAHNYSYASLPVYHFLADLQTLGLSGGVSFHWGSMARHFKYLPRVRYRSVILQEACWQLSAEDILPLQQMKEWLPALVTQFRLQWQMPRRLVLADGDNELLVDLDSRISVETFISAIRGRQQIILKEFTLPARDIHNGSGQAYCNQLVAILMHNGHVYAKNQALAAPVQATVQRRFLPGSEWVYYKIYCGTKTADEILVRSIEPLAGTLIAEGLIDKWFFIRYNDPDFHLRVRFHIADLQHTGRIMQLLLNAIREPEAEGLIITVQTDTYQRELERYGQVLTELAESLFYTDSMMKLEFLQLTEGDERERYRWLWGMRGVDELLSAFGLPLQKKYECMQAFQQSFADEFHADKALFRQMNQQYNEHRKDIQQIMEYPVMPENTCQPLLEIFDRYAPSIQATAASITTALQQVQQEAGLQGLLSGYIHMNLNRLFLSEPRQHELLIYDFLCSWYRSQLKRRL